MKKIKGILYRLLEILIVLLFLVLFIFQYFYPEGLQWLSISLKYRELLLMGLGIISILILSLRTLSLGWRILAILISILLIVESYFMSKSIS